MWLNLVSYMFTLHCKRYTLTVTGKTVVEPTSLLLFEFKPVQLDPIVSI